MKKTGQLLKETREKQGISINAVSAATKIGVKVLESIEAGDLSELPPKTFVRGFVQTYAMFLKIDVKQVMDMFQEEVGTTRYAPTFDKPAEGETPAPESATPKPAQKPSAVTPPLDKPGTGIAKWLMAALALFLFIAIYFVSQTVQKYKKESEVPTPGVEGEALPPSPIATSAPTETAAPEGSPAATTTPGASASPTPSATTAAEPTAAPSPQATATPQPAATNPQNVTLEALDNVKIEYQVDDGSIQTITLEPEQKKKFSAKKSLNVTISDGGAISVIHNGKDKGVPGNLGQPITLSFPPKE